MFDIPHINTIYTYNCSFMQEMCDPICQCTYPINTFAKMYFNNKILIIEICGLHKQILIQLYIYNNIYTYYVQKVIFIKLLNNICKYIIQCVFI